MGMGIHLMEEVPSIGSGEKNFFFLPDSPNLIYYTQDGRGSGGGTQKPRPMMKCAAFLQNFAESDQVLSD